MKNELVIDLRVFFLLLPNTWYLESEGARDAVEPFAYQATWYYVYPESLGCYPPTAITNDNLEYRY